MKSVTQFTKSLKACRDRFEAVSYRKGFEQRIPLTKEVVAELADEIAAKGYVVVYDSQIKDHVILARDRAAAEKIRAEMAEEYDQEMADSWTYLTIKEVNHENHPQTPPPAERDKANNPRSA